MRYRTDIRRWKGSPWNAALYEMPEDDPDWLDHFHAVRLGARSPYLPDRAVTLREIFDVAELPRTPEQIARSAMMDLHREAVEECRHRGIDPYTMRDSTDWTTAPRRAA